MSKVTGVNEARPLAVVVDASVWVSRLVPQDVHHEASRHWLEAFTEAAVAWLTPCYCCLKSPVPFSGERARLIYRG